MTSGNVDWIAPFHDVLQRGRSAESDFARSYPQSPSSGPERSRYLKEKWALLNRRDVQFARMVRAARPASQGCMLSQVPIAYCEFIETIGSFGGGHRWMPFSVFDLKDVEEYRNGDDVGSFEEVSDAALSAYRSFAVFGYLERVALMIRLSEKKKFDDLIIAFDYESRTSKVVSAGFQDLIRSVSFCIDNDLSMSVLSPRGKYRSWVLDQPVATPPEFFRENGTTFQFEKLSSLSPATRGELFGQRF